MHHPCKKTGSFFWRFPSSPVPGILQLCQRPDGAVQDRSEYTPENAGRKMHLILGAGWLQQAMKPPQKQGPSEPFIVQTDPALVIILLSNLLIASRFGTLFETASTRLSPHEGDDIKPFVSKLPTACFHRLRPARSLRDYSYSIPPKRYLTYIS